MNVEEEYQVIDHYLCIKMPREVDHHNAGKITEQADEMICRSEVKNLIFDFSSLSFMDSSGIGMIIGRYKLIHSIGGGVVLVCTSQRMKKLVTMSGLTRLIPVCSTVSQALNEIKGA